MANLLPSTGTSSPVLPPSQKAWIASDMDETFLSPTHTVSEETKRVYHKLRENNIQVIPATGRSLRALKRVLSIKSPEFFSQMKFFPGVYLNGTCVYGDSESDVIYAHKMDVDGLKDIVNGYYKLVENGSLQRCTVFLQHVSGSYVDYITDYFAAHLERWYEEVPEEINEPISVLLDQIDRFWCQVSIIGDPAQLDVVETELFKTPETLRILEEKKLHLMRPIPPMVTVIPGTESKAKALLKLMERYPQLKLDAMVAIGDGNNDIEMLKLSKWSIAMGQAADTVKAVAKHVAPPNAEHGWARSLESLVLSECARKKWITWICTDVDGTFLSANHTVSPLTEQTYAEARKTGIDIIFATGRTLTATKAVLERAKEFKEKYASFYPGIYCNGAYVVSHDPDAPPIVMKTLPLEALRIFANFAYSFFEAHADQRAVLMTHHTTGAFVDYDSEMWRSFQARYEEEQGEILNDRIDRVLEGPHYETVLQIHCCGDDKKVPAFKSALESDTETMETLARLGTYVVSGIPACVTLVRNDVSKAKALEQLSSFYKDRYPLSQALILGDGGNDKEMLQLQDAAMTVAMGQAPAWLQKLARHIAPSNAEEGWSRTVREFCLSNAKDTQCTNTQDECSDFAIKANT